MLIRNEIDKVQFGTIQSDVREALEKIPMRKVRAAPVRVAPVLVLKKCEWIYGVARYNERTRLKARRDSRVRKKSV